MICHRASTAWTCMAIGHLHSALLTSINRLREVNLTRLYLAFLISMRQRSGVSTAAFAPLALEYWGIDTRYCCRTTMQSTVSLGEKMANLDAERIRLEKDVIEIAYPPGTPTGKLQHF